MPNEKERALRSVAGHSNRIADIELARDRAIAAAHQHGASLREIADVAGVSHQQVKRILDRWKPTSGVSEPPST